MTRVITYESEGKEIREYIREDGSIACRIITDIPIIIPETEQIESDVNK